MMKKSLLAGALLLCPAAFAATTHWEYMYRTLSGKRINNTV